MSAYLTVSPNVGSPAPIVTAPTDHASSSETKDSAPSRPAAGTPGRRGEGGSRGGPPRVARDPQTLEPGHLCLVALGLSDRPW